MPDISIRWTPAEEDGLTRAYNTRYVGESELAFCTRYAASDARHGVDAVRGKLMSLRRNGVIVRSVQESPYPIYNEPLTLEGDALVITDLELPFHHAEFVNRCLDLAGAWKIPYLILGGDALHFDSLSGWEPNWTRKKQGGLSDADEKTLFDRIQKLPKKYQGDLLNTLVDIGTREEKDGASTELEIARHEMRRIEEQFTGVDFVLGNHEGRFLRTMQTALDPEELTRLLGVSRKWRIAPYYYSVLFSGGEKFQVEHPRNTAKASAWRLASKYGCHVLMGHNHHVVFQYDMSGKYFALEIGCGVDEDRLPYASQRHNSAHAHALGACIVRGGYPWLLHSKTDWQAMGRL